MCYQVAKNKCDPQFQKLANFLRIAKISPIFKETEVLPRRLPNFGKANNFVFLIIKLSVFFKHAGIKLQREKLLCSASARYSTYDGRTIFFSGPSDPSFYGFYNGNEEYERQFFRNAFDSYPGSGYRHQFSGEEMAARQTLSVASMEAGQSPSLASSPIVESSKSGESNNTNDNKGKKKVKYETWSQAEQILLPIQLWAKNHELLVSREARTA